MCCLGIGLAVAQPTEFTGSFEQLQAAAQQQNKPFVVYFYGSGCSACQSLEAQTLADPGIGKALNDRFLYMRLNAQSLERQGFQLAGKYRVSLFPTLLIFAPDGSVANTLTGLQTPAMLTPELNQVAPPPAPPKPKPAPKPATSSTTTTRARATQHTGWWLVDVKPLPNRGYGVQVGVFASYETVLQEINRLGGHYDYSMAIRSEFLNGQAVYKLVFGPFPNETQARQFERKYETSEGRDAVVILMGE